MFLNFLIPGLLGNVTDHPDLDNAREEAFVDVVCFGSKEAAMSLTLGVDLPISQLPLHARRELAMLLDPPDSMGRDWSILAVTLGLTEHLPEVDSVGPVISRTDQILASWALSDPLPTVGLLCSKLKELGRKDGVDTVCKCVSLYLLAVPIDDILVQNNNGLDNLNDSSDSGHPKSNDSKESEQQASPLHDSGVICSNINSTNSHLSTSSTLSR